MTNAAEADAVYNADIPEYEPDFDIDGFAEANAFRFKLRGEELRCRLFTLKEREETELDGKSARGVFEIFLEPDSFERFEFWADHEKAPLSPKTVRDLSLAVIRHSWGSGAEDAEPPKQQDSSPASKRKGRKQTSG